ncbi:MAG: hypothetical protein E6I53_05570 [Chloroflexi bacterium]|nr:MAG: hypothetical protein E6I53_05570 [Chloroflexota bacterium]
MSLSDLVLSIADNKQMLGLRYAEWATRAPSLEADIAAAAMGLDDLGHSRVLYGCLEPLGADPRGPDRESDAASLRNLAYFDEPWTEWSQFVAANAVLDTAFTAMIEACVGGSVGSGIEPGPLERAWQEAIEWFGPPDGETAALHREGKISMGPGELRADLEKKLDVKPSRQSIDWQRWDPVRRRGTPGAIDPHTFGMLRGLEEKKYAPSSAAKQTTG